MFKNMKKKILLASMAVLVFGNAMSVSAATQANSASYSGYVTKKADYVTDSLYKTVLGDATNEVSSITTGVSLCSWINNFIGLQVTNKADYDGTGTYTMAYKDDVEISIDRPGGHLSTTMTISTQWFEFTSANTSGTWSPDPF